MMLVHRCWQEKEYIRTEARQQFRQHAGASDASVVAALVSCAAVCPSTLLSL